MMDKNQYNDIGEAQEQTVSRHQHRRSSNLSQMQNRQQHIQNFDSFKKKK
jgi:hypothetical protein